MRWVKFREKSGALQDTAGKLLDDAGAHTHTVCRVSVNGVPMWEAWRRIKDPERFNIEYLETFDSKERAMAYCEADQHAQAA